MTCPGENQHYTQRKSRCPKDCSNMYTVVAVECQEDPLSGCECDHGYVLNNGTCIRAIDCPCNFNGRQLLPGQSDKDDCREW